eukprot:TRINITY_DN1045_c0_g1_i2.p1 TRINITY_DN1045_c0_g1~~TRINITY_DN1045_c0_g1_i2.p1  ORF type:complete len:830 (+),score=243.46 TRINITY_DN1045_c0_g1_i2:45-2534(+)
MAGAAKAAVRRKRSGGDAGTEPPKKRRRSRAQSGDRSPSVSSLSLSSTEDASAQPVPSPAPECADGSADESVEEVEEVEEVSDFHDGEVEVEEEEEEEDECAAEDWSGDALLEHLFETPILLHEKLSFPSDTPMPPYRLLGTPATEAPELWAHTLAALADEWCCAYLNTVGGLLFLGVAPDGTIEGIPINTHPLQLHTLLSPFFSALDQVWPSVSEGLITLSMLPVSTPVSRFDPYHVIVIRVRKGPLPLYLNSRNQALGGDHKISKLSDEDVALRLSSATAPRAGREMLRWMRAHLAPVRRRPAPFSHVVHGGSPYVFRYRNHWSHPPLTWLPDCAMRVAHHSGIAVKPHAPPLPAQPVASEKSQQRGETAAAAAAHPAGDTPDMIGDPPCNLHGQWRVVHETKQDRLWRTQLSCGVCSKTWVLRTHTPISELQCNEFATQGHCPRGKRCPRVHLLAQIPQTPTVLKPLDRPVLGTPMAAPKSEPSPRPEPVAVAVKKAEVPKTPSTAQPHAHAELPKTPSTVQPHPPAEPPPDVPPPPLPPPHTPPRQAEPDQGEVLVPVPPPLPDCPMSPYSRPMGIRRAPTFTTPPGSPMGRVAGVPRMSTFELPPVHEDAAGGAAGAATAADDHPYDTQPDLGALRGHPIGHQHAQHTSMPHVPPMAMAPHMVSPLSWGHWPVAAAYPGHSAGPYGAGFAPPWQPPFAGRGAPAAQTLCRDCQLSLLTNPGPCPVTGLQHSSVSGQLSGGGGGGADHTVPGRGWSPGGRGSPAGRGRPRRWPTPLQNRSRSGRGGNSPPHLTPPQLRRSPAPNQRRPGVAVARRWRQKPGGALI